MAAVTKYFGTVALNGTSEVTVTLNPEYAYHIKHTGVDATGTDDAQSAISAFLSYASGLASVTPAEEDDKYALLDGQEVIIGPGISTLYIDSTTGADGILTFSRQGEATRIW